MIAKKLVVTALNILFIWSTISLGGLEDSQAIDILRPSDYRWVIEESVYQGQLIIRWAQYNPVTGAFVAAGWGTQGIPMEIMWTWLEGQAVAEVSIATEASLLSRALRGGLLTVLAAEVLYAGHQTYQLGHFEAVCDNNQADNERIDRELQRLELNRRRDQAMERVVRVVANYELWRALNEEDTRVVDQAVSERIISELEEMMREIEEDGRSEIVITEQDRQETLDRVRRELIAGGNPNPTEEDIDSAIRAELVAYRRYNQELAELDEDYDLYELTPIPTQ